MSDPLAFTTEEARRFAERHGLTWLGPDDLATLTEALGRMVAAGQAVTRVASRFDAPAPVFRTRLPPGA